MQTIELTYSANAEHMVEVAARSFGLQLAARSSLKKYPGCTHLHYRRTGKAGTLEITLWPEKNRCWISARRGRTQPWVREVAETLERQFKSHTRSRQEL